MSTLAAAMRLLTTATLFSFAAFLSVHAKDQHMPQHTQGTFTVEIKPETPTPAEGVSRYTINKQIHGGLEATTQGEMFSAGDPQHGHAGYVAIERVSGTLNGKQGSFVLQHLATMDASGSHMQVQIVPGSGTGQLQGISGTFDITIIKGDHKYDLTYDLPGA